MTENFDWTQFITFEADYCEYHTLECAKDIFEKIGFNIIPKHQISLVKSSYYKEIWKEFRFELENTEFLYAFGDWDNIGDPPFEIVRFVQGINLLLTKLKIKTIRIVICSFAEKGHTDNLIVDANNNEVFDKLFLMSGNSLVCPDNLIINYHYDRFEEFV